jgi:SAM-dependent methyltransferase
MAFDFHKDKERYFKMQTENAVEYMLPFIEKELPITKGMKVLEIGCAEGGVIKAFIDRGCIGYGVELSPSRLAKAKQNLAKEESEDRAFLINKNIYDVDFEQEMQGQFDLIILKDVIEHIFDQNKLIHKLRDFLKPEGHIFFGFPPWQMPFGGHQQVAKSKLLSKFPYFHLLPTSIYKGVLKTFNESDETITELLEIKETGISIERFERICKENNYSIKQRTFYLVNPIYTYKFKMKALKQLSPISALPWARNFVTTCMYYLIKKEELN